MQRFKKCKHYPTARLKCKYTCKHKMIYKSNSAYTLISRDSTSLSVKTHNKASCTNSSSQATKALGDTYIMNSLNN